MKELSKTIELPDEKILHVALEGRPPNCFKYRQKGCIKKCYILHTPNDIVEIINCQQDDKGSVEKTPEINVEQKIIDESNTEAIGWKIERTFRMRKATVDR